ncbi:MAG: GNAT family N-acetyltransferase [Bacillota bacterium]|nr:GNAT family N-acetyltransferase [Bacillota bacterium]
MINTIQKIPLDDSARVATIIASAYPGFELFSEEKKTRFEEIFTQVQNEEPTTNYYGLYKQENLVGLMRLHDFKMNLLSTMADVGGIGLVAVDLLHKKENVAKEMLTYFLTHYKEKEASMVSLYPFRVDFYKKMGFGVGPKMDQYRVKPDSFPKGRSKEHIERLNINDKNELLACYNRYLFQTAGMIEKTESELNQLFNRPENHVYAYREGDKILGYIVFSFKRASTSNFVLNDMVIKEWIYETPDALSEMMTFLHSQADQINRIELQTQDESFHILLSDPWNDADHVIPPVYRESHTTGVGLMYRVIDTENFFRTLKDHDFGNQTCRVKFTIADSFFSDNNRSVVVHFEKGQPSIDSLGEYEVEVSLDVSDFSSLVMGAVTFKSLFNYGLVQISDESYLPALHSLLYREQKPRCTTVF